MTNSKRKGSDFERAMVKKLNNKLNGGEFKRIPGSGSIGTNLSIPSLQGDLLGTIKGIVRKVKVECKVGYGNEKQLTLKKEWLDKISEEASRDYSIPILIGRFTGSRNGVEEFVVMDLNVFIELMNLITELGETIDEFYE